MSKHLSCFAVLPILAITASIVSAQGLTLKDRSVIELQAGLWGGAKVSNTINLLGVNSTADVGSFVGSILYAYGLQEDIAITISAGVLTANANTSIEYYGVRSEASTVMPLLVGIRYYVPAPESGAKVRPFLSLSVGSYIGFDSGTNLGNTVVIESRSESAFGGRLGVGLDLYTGYHFKFVVNAGYNLMTDFAQSIGARANYNGGDFSIGIGYAI